jgi:hypothetical protein
MFGKVFQVACRAFSMAALRSYPFHLTPRPAKTHSITRSIPFLAASTNHISFRAKAMTTAASDGGFDRAAAVKQFDESRTGVKGLVDAGVTEIPSMFRHNPDPALPAPAGSVSVPTIDLSLPRGVVVDNIRSASHEWGFFQVTAASYNFCKFDTVTPSALDFGQFVLGV